MKRKSSRGLGLVFATLLTTSAAAWVLFAGASRAAPGPADVDPELALRRSERAGRGTPLLRRVSATVESAGPTVEDQLQRLGVPAWHAAGFRGRGVKVAILDSGFRGYRAALGKVLPASVQVRSFRKDGDLEAKDSQHGILCGEVIHRLAPEAELLFANWEPEQPEEFLAAVRWARREGARVLSCSIIMPTWSDGEGNGPAHDALRAALGDGNAPADGLLVASAGNTALRHWGGQFRAGRDGWNEWAPGHTENALKPLGSERVSVELSAPRGSAFEVVVRDGILGEVGRGVTDPARPTSCVAVRFEPRWGHRYAIKVRAVPQAEARAAGARTPPGPFHLVILGGRLAHARAEGSIPFPADGREVIAVGAFDETGRRMSYSSCGAGGTGRACKPDLAAVVPSASVWRPDQAFAGTSAASPQAAGLAALLWSRHADWTAGRVRAELCRSRRPDGKPGPDAEMGHGLLRLP